MKVITGKGNFFKLFGAPTSVVQYLRYSVSQAYRYFETEDKPHWCVHRDYLIYAIQLGYSELGYVDYSDISADLQVEIAKSKSSWKVRNDLPDVNINLKYEECFASLFLTPNAPHEIVDAVWKAVVRKYHPDVGGDEDRFVQMKDAYEKIKGISV